MNLKIQNYTGAVTIGITKFIGYETEPLDKSYWIDGFSDGNNNHVKFYILYQGLRKPEVKTISNKTDSNTTKDNRIQGLSFKKGDFLEVIPFFEPVSSSFLDINQDPNTMGEEALFADEEFVVRNGETIEPLRNITSKKLELLTQLKDDNIGLEALKMNNDDAIQLFTAMGGGKMCRKKISDIYIY